MKLVTCEYPVSQLGKVSVIIPLGPCEDLWRDLVTDLQLLPEKAEIIFVFSDINNPRNHRHVKYSGRACDVPAGALPQLFRLKKDSALIRQLGERRLVLVQSYSGRAIEMNAGSKFASGQFLWFLHADSHFTKQALEALNLSLMKDPQALYFFRLTFMKDGEVSALTGINQWGARIRSEIFNVPFGDQGFCISKDNFYCIGGYPEDVRVGEDHVFLWHARQHGIKPICTKAELFTSARKYSSIGWGRLTLKYQYLWIKQAIPEVLKLYLRGEKS